MKKMLMNTEIKLAIYQSFKEDLINLLDKVETLISEEYLYIKCPRKIRDKEHSAEQKLTKCQFLREEDMNEFLECHLEKVSSGGSKVRGDNCDTRLNEDNDTENNN